MMKIMAVADLHNDFKNVKKLANRAKKEKIDIVLICGDITFFDDYINGMIGPFLDKKTTVMFVPGNHDSHITAEYIVQKYDILNLHERTAEIKNVGFVGLGGANVGPNITNEEDAKIYLSRGFEDIEDMKKKILVTHVHPASCKVEEEWGFPGSDAVTEAIYEFQPNIHVHGHIHEAEGSVQMIGKTKSICVGKKGTIFKI